MTLFSMNGRPIKVGDRVRLHATEGDLREWAIDWLGPSSAEGTVLHADLREGGVLPVLVRFDSLNTGRWVPPENLEHLSPADPEPEFKPGDRVYVPKDALASYGPVLPSIAGQVVTLKTLDDGESPSDAQVYIPGSEGEADGAVSVLAEWLRKPATSLDGRKILGSPTHVAPAGTPLGGDGWKPLGTISEDGLSVDWGDSGGPLVDTAAIEVALESNRPFTPPRIELCGEDLLNLLDSKVLTTEEARTLLGF